MKRLKYPQRLFPMRRKEKLQEGREDMIEIEVGIIQRTNNKE
jgi:hypothetical protein